MLLKDVKKGDKFEGFAILSDLEERTTGQGKPYISFLLKDKEVSVFGKVWDTKLEDIKALKISEGQVVKVSGSISEWNEELQITIDKDNGVKMRGVVSSDEINVNDFVKSAPVETEDMFQYLRNVIKQFKNKTLKDIVGNILGENKEKLTYYPAAKQIHHAYKGGLLYHIYEMTKLAESYMDKYSNLNYDLLMSGVMLHDIGKLKELNSNAVGVADFSTSGRLLGHTIEGIKMVNRAVVLLESSGQEVDEESVELLEHMIASHHYEEQWGAYQKPMIIEAQLLHHLDLLDSKMEVFSSNLKNVDEGKFSQNIFGLENRKIYNHKL